jgi:hypothetical protein
MLRLWRENGGETVLWRASLERPQSERRQGFASLAELVAYLEEEMGVASEVQDSKGVGAPDVAI